MDRWAGLRTLVNFFDLGSRASSSKVAKVSRASAGRQGLACRVELTPPPLSDRTGFAPPVIWAAHPCPYI